MAEETEIIIKGSFKNGKVIISETERLEKNIQGIGFASDKSDISTNRLNSTLRKIAAITGIAFLAKQFTSLTKSTLQAAGSMEQVDIALTTMLGSAEQAAKLQKDLIQFAKKTPFEIEGIFQSTKQLLAYGIAQEDIIDTMSTLGNISAGLGVDMNRLALVFGQVRSTGKLMGQDLNQFTQAGVPLLAELAKLLGTTEAEVIKLKESGQISFEQVKMALEQMTAEGGRFFNLMENQSSTYLGTLSNLQDSFFQIKTAIGNALLPVAKELAVSLVENFNNLLVIIERNQENIQKFARAFVVSISSIGEAFKNAFSIIFASFRGLYNIFNGFQQRMINMSIYVDIFSMKFKLSLNELKLKFYEFIESIVDRMATLSNIPGFGFTETLKNNFTEAKESILNDITQIQDAIVLMNQTLLANQQEKDTLDLEQKQAKADQELEIESTQAAQSIEIQAQKAEEKNKIDKFITKAEKIQDSARFKGAKQTADALVDLQNSKSKELAAIGKAAAIFNITNDAASGAMSAYKGMVQTFPGPVGVGLGTAAAAAVIAYGVERVATVTGNSFAVGTPNIPQDQIAQVHKGEMIVPATFSDAIRSGELTLSGNSSTYNESQSSVNINISFEGANFVGQMSDDDVAMIANRMGQLINENIITSLPTKMA